MAFSLTEKLAVAGAFLALVALAVGTETDPGVIATSQVATKRAGAPGPDARPEAPARNYWSGSGDAPAAEPAAIAAPPAPPPDNLPPGFGATPPPELQR